MGALLRFALVAAGLLAAQAFAGAGTLFLKDGRVFDDVDVSRTPDGVRVTYASGEIMVPYALVLEAIGDSEEPFEPTTDERVSRRSMHCYRYPPPTRNDARYASGTI